MTAIDRQSAFSGTREVAAPLRFDAARLEAWLTGRVAGFGGPLAVGADVVAALQGAIG